jgi:hypothetical protein
LTGRRSILVQGLIGCLALSAPTVGGGSSSPVAVESPAARRQTASSSTALAPVTLDWLDRTAPAVPRGVSFGVPWPRGALRRDTALALAAADGRSVSLQTWPLAYWPDGSLKWTGHAISAGRGLPGPMKISIGPAAVAQPQIRATSTQAGIEIDTGAIRCRIPHRGQAFLESLRIGDQEVVQQASLIVVREDRSGPDGELVVREERFESDVTSVTLERSGPVRAVVRIDGRHARTNPKRAWLPFTIRLAFHAGLDSVQIVHSFVFDGDQQKDYIRGLGLRFSVPMREQFHNRHVRLAGEEGVLAEPVRLIAGRRNPSPQLYAAQIAGKRIPNLEELPGRANVEMMAVWDGYKLAQTSADSFSIQKRTGAHSSWITAAAGRRSPGTAFIGDVSGGIAVGMKDFWQLAPTALEVGNASTGAAELTAWLWSPDAPAMDLRHYDVKEHGLEASYEDIDEGFSTATGVARTTELTIHAFGSVPTNGELVEIARAISKPARLVATPEYYHSIPVFGIWSLPDRSQPARKWIEEQLDAGITFYQSQIEQRRWYGFWDYGDVMHSYDGARHQWRYDIGGFAWANTELMPDLWLWYSFLRTGRADVFRMAEAMTRHTQEVDVYHLGRLAGLGSRHNVRHWGDGAKEVRISQALLKRIYYYLTADERTGDLMTEVVDADFKMAEIDPLRKIEPKTQYPTHARVGPDWFALVSNWLAAWERTGEVKYRDKIMTGMKSMAAMPRKLFSGSSYGYDPETGRLFQLHDDVFVPHLAALMGGPELNFELTPLVDLAEWNEAWLHYCRYLQAPEEEQRRVLGGVVNNGRGPHYARMTAYAAHVMKDADLAARAWREFLRPETGGVSRALFAAGRISGADVPVAVDEVARASTNNTAQWSLNAIQLLEMVGRFIPPADPRWSEAVRR